MSKIYKTIIFLLLLSPVCGQADTKPTVAILWFENRSPDRTLDYLINHIPDIIVTELSNVDWCIPLEREEIRKAIEEVILSKDGFVSPETTSGRHNIEPADYLFSGYFTKDKENLHIIFHFYDWRRGRKETKEITTVLSQIKTVASFGVEYLRGKISAEKPQIVAEKHAVESMERQILLFFNIKEHLDCEDVTGAYSMYSYPFKAILLNDLLEAFSSRGIKYTVVQSPSEWHSRKDFEPHAHRYALYVEMTHNPSGPLTAYLWSYGTGDAPLKGEYGQMTEFKNLNFGELKTGIAKKILREYGQDYEPGPFVSPMSESLVYYENFIKQGFYHNNDGRLNEILKALYLYPDFSFYWYILAEAYRSLDEYKGEVAALQKYLLMASFEKHPMLYQSAVTAFIRRIQEQNMLSYGHINFLIALLEERLFDSCDVNWKDRNLAVYLSRFYIITETNEEKHKILLRKKLMSELEYHNAAACVFLSEKLKFGKNEKITFLSGMLRNLEYHWVTSTNWEKNFNPLSVSVYRYIKDTYGKNRDTQRDFFDCIYRTLQLYPDSVTAFYLICYGAEKFEKDISEEFMAKISQNFPDSIPAYYWKLKNLEDRFFSDPGNNKKEIVKDIIILTLDKLMNPSFLHTFLNDCIKQNIREDILTIVFLESYKHAPLESKQHILYIAPEFLKQKLVDSHGFVTPAPETTTSAILLEHKKQVSQVLVGLSLKEVAELIKTGGFEVGLLKENIDSDAISSVSLIIVSLNDIYSYDAKKSLYILNIPLLETITKNLREGTFILIVPHRLAQSAKGDILTKLNEFLAQFDCYLDAEKRCNGTAVLLPGLFKETMDANLNYHGALNISSGVSHQWEKFYIDGYPIYSEGETSLIGVGENYTAAVSFPLPAGGTCIVSGQIYPLFYYDISPFSQNFYLSLICRNIWGLLLENLLGERKELTPVPIIKKLYDLQRSVLSLSLMEKNGYRYADPLARWRDENPSLDENKTSQPISIGEEVLQMTDDVIIRTHCHICLGLLYKATGRKEQALQHFAKAYEMASASREKTSIGLMLLDSSISAIKGKEQYSFYSSLYDEVFQMLGANYSEPELSEISLPFYDLKGRLEEAAGNYDEAILAYLEQNNQLVKMSYHSVSKRLYAYPLFRIAEICYIKGDFKKAEEFFTQTVTTLSREWPHQKLQPDSADSYTFYGEMSSYNTVMPNPFSTKVSSLVYLREIAMKNGRAFFYADELEETMSLAREWGAVTKSREVSYILDTIVKIVNQHNY